ncbi:MAG: ester cyclase [Bacteroidetes bacterium]|nr:ester cyclase [Bacteroidota bacterium]
MKKVVLSLLLLAATSSVIYSQTKTENKKMETSANKEITLGLSRAIMNGQWDKVDALLDDNFSYTGDGQAPINKQQYIYFMKEILSKGFMNMDMKFHRVIEEGNIVAVDYTNEMTNSGEYFGIPATGKRIFSTGQFMREIKNGKVVAEWQTTNTYGMMVQLGVIPAPQGK